MDLVWQNMRYICHFWIFELSQHSFLIPVAQRGHIGDTWYDLENLLIILTKKVYIPPDLRPWADNTHLSTQHVDQLREFVDLCPAQHPTELRDPGIGTGRDRSTSSGSVHHHSAKFVDEKGM